MYYLCTLVLFDSTYTGFVLVTATCGAMMLILLVAFGAAITVGMLAAGFSLASTVLALRYGCCCVSETVLVCLRGRARTENRCDLRLPLRATCTNSRSE
jgi:hypothetical protein